MINIKKVGLYFSAAVISCASLSSMAANQNDQSQQDAYAAACASYLGNVDPSSYSAAPIAPYQTIQACIANSSCSNPQLANITDCTTKLATLAATSINNTAQQVAGSAGGGGMQSTYQAPTQNTAPVENTAPVNNASDTHQNSSKTTDSGKGVNWF